MVGRQGLLAAGALLLAAGPMAVARTGDMQASDNRAGARTAGAAAPAQAAVPGPAAAAQAQAQAAAVAASGTAAPLDAAVFAELPEMEAPALSPDGKRIAAKISGDGQQYFAVFDADGSNLHGAALGGLDLNWWRWINDQWLVIGVGRTTSVAGQDAYVTRAVGIEASTGRVVQLNAPGTAQNGDDLIWVAGDGSPRVLIASQTSLDLSDPGFWRRVEEVDVSTGRRRMVLSGREGVRSWYADASGAIRMGVGATPDGRQRRLLYRPGGEGRFREIDRARGIDETLVVPSLFLPDPDRALVIQDDAQGYSALYEYDLKTMQRGRQLFARPGFDLDELVIDAQHARLLGVRVVEDRPTTHWLDPELAALQRRLAERVKGAQVEITDFNRDRSIAMVRVGGASAPGAYFLYRAAGDSLTDLARNNPKLGMRRLHPVRTIRYKARDGLEIAAVLTLPRNRPAQKLPLIVMPHGGPFARDTEEWDWWTQFMADRGYAVIQPNYRGSSGYGTAFAEKGRGQWGLAMQDDLNDAVKALAEQGVADPKRVCIVGASYGGYAALRGAQRDGALFRCAVAYAGVSDLGRMAQYDQRFLGAGARNDWLRAQAPDFRAISPLFHVEDFTIPTLIVHGRKDQVVPFSQGKLMADRLKAAGKPVTFIEQPLGDHQFTRREDRLTFLKALEAFLAANNPA